MHSLLLSWVTLDSFSHSHLSLHSLLCNHECSSRHQPQLSTCGSYPRFGFQAWEESSHTLQRNQGIQPSYAPFYGFSLLLFAWLVFSLTLIKKFMIFSCYCFWDVWRRIYLLFVSDLFRLSARFRKMMELWFPTWDSGSNTIMLVVQWKEGFDIIRRSEYIMFFCVFSLFWIWFCV